MFKSRLCQIIGLIFCLVPMSLAQEDEPEDMPVIAILKFGSIEALNLSEQGTLDLLAAYGYEDGETVEIVLGDAQFDIDVTNDLVEFALERDPDIIVAISTPVSLATLNFTSELENPPVVLFNSVTSPYGAGIAVSPCLHEPYITGAQAFPPHAVILDNVLQVVPSIDTIGVIYNDQELNSVINVEVIEEVAEDLGLDVVAQSVPNGNAVRAVAEAMIMSDIDAFYIPTDSTAVSAMDQIAAVGDLAGVPVFVADVSQVYNGATVAIGLNYYQEGVDTGRLIVNYLENDLDIARTAIYDQTEVAIAVNLDRAETQGVTISDEFLATTDFVIENGESTQETPALERMSLEERMEVDAAFIEALACTDEQIEAERDEFMPEEESDE